MTNQQQPQVQPATLPMKIVPIVFADTKPVDIPVVERLVVQLAVMRDHEVSERSLITMSFSHGKWHVYLNPEQTTPQDQAVRCGSVDEIVNANMSLLPVAASLLYTADVKRQFEQEITVIARWTGSAADDINLLKNRAQRVEARATTLEKRAQKSEKELAQTNKMLGRQRWLNGALVVLLLLIGVYVANNIFKTIESDRKQALYEKIMGEPAGDSYQATELLEGKTVPKGQVLVFIGGDMRLKATYEGEIVLDVTSGEKEVVAILDEGTYIEYASLRSPDRFRFVNKGEFLEVRGLLVADYKTTHLLYGDPSLFPEGTILG